MQNANIRFFLQFRVRNSEIGSFFSYFVCRDTRLCVRKKPPKHFLTADITDNISDFGTFSSA